jgi:amidase
MADTRSGNRLENELHFASLSDVCRRIKSGELTSVRVTEHLLERIRAKDGDLRSYVTVLDGALDAAERLDRLKADGKPLGALHGVPIAVKDLLSMRGVRTTCGTKVMKDWIPEETATVVERLEHAGAVIIGKVKLTEGAFSAHHPDVAAPRNPWNPNHWTGVSSSGSGVSVAAGLAFGALGTDTGGSIRFPSASCGIVGLKPTYGRVSRHGCFPLADSLDHIGPMTRTVEDAARLLGAMAGFDPRDPTSRRDPVPNYSAAIDQPLAGLVIGVDDAYIETGVAPDVVGAVREALRMFETLGANTREVRLPDHRHLARNWVVTCGVETALAHRDFYPARRTDYGPELAGLIEVGRNAAASTYAELERARERYRAELDAVLDRADVVIAPCMLSTAPPIDEMARLAREGEPGAFIIFTAPFNYSGHPSLTLPFGLNAAGLPLAFQLIGRHLAESTLIRAGSAFEKARGPMPTPKV